MSKIYVVVDLDVPEHFSAPRAAEHLVPQWLRKGLEEIGVTSVTVNGALALTADQVSGLVHYTKLGVDRSEAPLQRSHDRLEELRQTIDLVEVKRP
jgi:hypothetical protein